VRFIGWTFTALLRGRDLRGRQARLAGRIATTPEELELCASSLGADDRVVLEVTGNALAIARIIEPYVEQGSSPGC
jgi:hypothetical protein